MEPKDPIRTADQKEIESLRTQVRTLRAALLEIRHSCLPDYGSYEVWVDWCLRVAEDATVEASQW